MGSYPTQHVSTKFCGNPSCSFCAKLTITRMQMKTLTSWWGNNTSDTYDLTPVQTGWLCKVSLFHYEKVSDSPLCNFFGIAWFCLWFTFGTSTCQTRLREDWKEESENIFLQNEWHGYRLKVILKFLFVQHDFSEIGVETVNTHRI